MAHQVQNFEIHAGDDLTLQVSVTDDAGQPVNLTGAQVAWQASRGRADRFSSTAVLAKASGTGITVTDAAGGVFEVDLAAADTAGLRGAFYHEAKVTDAAGDKSTVFTGTMTVLPSLIS